MPNIRLQSSDKDVFEVDLKTLECSGTIKNMIETLGGTEDEDEAIPLTEVNTEILRKVIEWADYHKNDPPAPKEDPNKEKRTDDICAWDQQFLDIDKSTLFQLLTAANFLDIKGLIAVSCKTIANMLKGKTAEQVRQEFNIVNDLPAPAKLIKTYE